jgi:aspartate kinase
MNVFKFGGASIQSAAAIRNVLEIIRTFGKGRLLVVVSAMGTTTNRLEEVLHLVRTKGEWRPLLDEIKQYHLGVAQELVGGNAKIKDRLAEAFEGLEIDILDIQSHDTHYDRVVQWGELLSSLLMHEVMVANGLPVHWADAREFVRTNDAHREATVLWDITQTGIRERLLPILEEKMVITQGFIGSDLEGNPTTLGRDGSDFTGAIFASCLQADGLTIWKDVPGILNADPKLIPHAQRFEELPYKEAAEMTFYGASVIHPKTIKPLANAQIPLFVKSFYHPEAPGTVIHPCQVDGLPPTIIHKPKQCLVTFKVIDFSFINERNVSIIFDALDKLNLRINLMQNSAISFSVCFDYNLEKLERLQQHLRPFFRIAYNTDLHLLTVLHYKGEAIERFRKNTLIILEQVSRSSYQVLTHEPHNYASLLST